MLLLGGYIFAFFYSAKITRWRPQVEYNNLKIKKGESVQIRLRAVGLSPVLFLPTLECGGADYFIISS